MIFPMFYSLKRLTQELRVPTTGPVSEQNLFQCKAPILVRQRRVDEFSEKWLLQLGQTKQ